MYLKFFWGKKIVWWIVVIYSVYVFKNSCISILVMICRGNLDGWLIDDLIND